ncbi:MAG TPA: hypothetical protein VI258_06420 [Rhodanobacteraceae bacterium]
MNIRADKVRHTLDFFRDIDLLSAPAVDQVLWLFAPDFAFRVQLEAADSIHVHIKVQDTELLPHDAIRNAGGRPESAQAGYVKYVFPAGVNVIFSSIPMAEDDRLATAAKIARPFLDHVGIDIRKATSDTRRRFDAVAEIAARTGWRHVAQGGAGRAVYCCHTEVGEKHWVYPPANLRAWARPIEFAFGPLAIHAGKMGCDLRPIDPAHPRAREVGCCGSESAGYASAPDTGCDAGDLSGREQVLVALAAAHARQSRPAIEAATTKCLEAGVSLEATREVAHRVASTLLAGETLPTRNAQPAATEIA